jgi:16S rRNA (adenine1518-N6/adenine1519-N6)-dimethyltransferase
VPKSYRPKLGQHFLIDRRYQQRILDALDIRSEDLVVEIGAGRGAMTGLLARRARSVVAVEVDPVLVEKLKTEMRDEPRVEILRADVLSTDIAELCRLAATEQCFIFGNLPYYITSPILHHLFAFRTRIRSMALLVQREVAGRITAEPGRRAYGYLSVLAQIYSQPRVVLAVPPGAFSPPPKVHSALVSFAMQTKFPEWPTEDYERFLEFVKRCFAQKRKSLRNNLARTHGRQRIEQELGRLDLAPDVRAEQLTMQQLAYLYYAFSERGT